MKDLGLVYSSGTMAKSMRECGRMESRRDKAYGDHPQEIGAKDNGKGIDKMEKVHSNIKIVLM